MKNITETSATAIAPTRLVEGNSSSRPHPISKTGRLSANGPMKWSGQYRERRDTVSKLQWVPDLVHTRIEENRGQSQAQRKDGALVDPFRVRGHGPVPVATGSFSADHSCHPPVKTLTSP